MALFNSSNPTLKDKIFVKEAQTTSNAGVMTINGTIGKTFLLLGMVILAGAVTWQMVMKATTMSSVTPWMIGGAIGGFIMAMVVCFKPATAPWAAPVYAALEGLFLGAISAFFELMFAESFPGIVITAVAITLVTMLVMLSLYRSGIIKVTNKFRSVMLIAIGSVAAFYLVVIVLNLFKVATPFIHGSSLLSIGISVVIVIIAALSLLLDFDFIEKGSAAGAPKYMEWYGAFGLMVTLVWLYLEILKLLAKLANRN
ncbi:MAG: Bax inhibitor-1/YccA family protein [Prevotellaceae bacterium]|jgi:uncharacterized YccA/Bax inhibitor family protein|nr:Bax inhibitor-1/YccA family protein [Prevotellaceae bacterium]